MFVPEFNKPDSPGIAMGFDNTVSIYQIVEADDTFETAAQEAFGLLREAQNRFPDWPRVFYLDVIGHEGDAGGFHPDFFEFQQEFLLGTLGPFYTALHLPLTGGLVNPEPQRNDMADGLRIGSDTGGDGSPT